MKTVIFNFRISLVFLFYLSLFSFLFGSQAPVFSLKQPASATENKIILEICIPDGGSITEDGLVITWPDAISPVLDEGASSMKALSTADGAYYSGSGFICYNLPSENVPDSFIFTVTYSLCIDGICYLPKKETFSWGKPSSSSALSSEIKTARPSIPRLKMVSSNVGYQSADEFSSWLNDNHQPASHSGPPSERSNPLIRILKNSGWILTVLFIILLGISLNLTPCVLPMIPINLAIIGAKIQNEAGNWQQGLVLGSLYGLGQALAFGAIGGLFVAFGGMFGSFTHTVLFNLSIAAIFIFLGLSMLDIFSIDFARFRGGMANSAKKNKNIHLTAAFLGVLSALLAGSCIAPVLLWVLILGAELYAGGQIGGLFLPLLLGIGMGLPWPLLAGGLSRLPKPGAWMNKIKIAFAVIIFITAAYYSIAAIRLISGVSTSSSYSDNDKRWNTDIQHAIQQSRETGKFLLIDFWCVSCKNCDAMDATTLQASSVITAMENYIPLKINADIPDDTSAALLKEFGIIGLPTYVIAQPE